jgi:hypothetical protein
MNDSPFTVKFLSFRMFVKEDNEKPQKNQVQERRPVTRPQPKGIITPIDLAFHKAFDFFRSF